jgi:purine-binding chemotaxis protein CheW
MLDLDFLTSDDKPERSDDLAAVAPIGELCLRFSVPSGQEFALPASAICEVMCVGSEKIAPIPNASPYLMGTFNWRGQAIWIGDLGHFLGDRVTIDADLPELTLLIVEDREEIMGLAVRAVANTEWLDPKGVPSSANLPETMVPFILGESPLPDTENRTLQLLDRAALIRSNRWAA